MINIIIDSNKMYNILQEGVARKKERKPPIREEKINSFRNFRTTELIFLTRVERKTYRNGRSFPKKKN